MDILFFLGLGFPLLSAKKPITPVLNINSSSIHMLSTIWMLLMEIIVPNRGIKMQ